MHYLDKLAARVREAEAFWEREHGPWNRRGSYPPHKEPPCFDCWADFKFCEDGRIGLTDIQRATTLFDAPEGRVLVCEPHWLRRMRRAGYSNAEILTILIEQGDFSAEDAGAMLAEDAVP
jgi:hypothetical protein